MFYFFVKTLFLRLSIWMNVVFFVGVFIPVVYFNVFIISSEKMTGWEILVFVKNKTIFHWAVEIDGRVKCDMIWVCHQSRVWRLYVWCNSGETTTAVQHECNECPVSHCTERLALSYCWRLVRQLPRLCRCLSCKGRYIPAWRCWMPSGNRVTYYCQSADAITMILLSRAFGQWAFFYSR